MTVGTWVATTVYFEVAHWVNPKEPSKVQRMAPSLADWKVGYLGINWVVPLADLLASTMGILMVELLVECSVAQMEIEKDNWKVALLVVRTATMTVG